MITDTQKSIVMLALLLLAPMAAQAQNNIITTVAGGGPNNVPAFTAPLNGPQAVAADKFGNFYIASPGANRVYKVNVTGNLTVLAGNGSAGFSGDLGPADQAQLYGPTCVAVEPNGIVLIADANNTRVRMVFGGMIMTVAGNGNYGYSGEGGPASQASLGYVMGLATDPSGNIYVSDYTSNRVLKFTIGGNISTVAGTGIAGYTGDGGPAISAELENPWGVAVDPDGNVFVSVIGTGWNFDVIRIITKADGNINTFASNLPTAPLMTTGLVALGVKNVLSADPWNYVIREVTPAGNTIVAGTFGQCCYGGDGGPATNAYLGGATGVAIDPSFQSILVADQGNNLIRQFTIGGNIQTVAGNRTQSYGGDGGPAVQATLSAINYVNPQLQHVAIDHSGNLYLSDTFNNVIRRVNPVSGLIDTVAGNYWNSGWYWGDGFLATDASLSAPSGMAFDPAGNLLFADTNNNVIRKVDATTSIITTIAGTATAGYGGDGGPATDAMLFYPSGLAVDWAGNIFIADTVNQVIRRVDAATGLISTVAGNGNAGYNGDGQPATSAWLNWPQGVAVDTTGNIYIADTQNYIIRKVDAMGTITTVAGIAGLPGWGGDGSDATSAYLYMPADVLVDGAHNLFIADAGNHVIRQVTTAGIIQTVVGNSSLLGFSGDGGPATSAGLSLPGGIAGDTADNLYVFDAGSARVRQVTNLYTPVLGPPPGAPQFSASPSPLTFANTAESSYSSQMLTLSNSGGGTLTLNPVYITGANAADFSFGTDGTCGSMQFILTAGQSCTLEVYFIPKGYGPRTASLQFFDNAAGNPHYVDLAGTGLITSFGTKVILDPSSLDFGNQAVGTSSGPGTITLGNWGPDDATITAVAISAQNDFIQSAGTCPQTPFTLKSGTTCVAASITFYPYLAGTRTGALNVAENIPGGNYSASLKGTGTLPNGVSAVLPGGNYAYDIAVNAVTNKIYVANESSNSVTVIDGATNGTSTVSVGRAPVALAVNDVTNTIYVANEDGITVIDGATNNTTLIPMSSGAWDVAVNKVTNKIYSVAYLGSYVYVFDGTNNSLIIKGDVGSSSLQVAVNETTNKIYVSCDSYNAVAILDGATNAVMRLETAPMLSKWRAARYVAVDSAANKVFLTTDGTNEIIVLDIATLSYAQDPSNSHYYYITGGMTILPAGDDPRAIVANPVTHMAYAVNWHANTSQNSTVTVVDGVGLTSSSVPVGQWPMSIAINTASNKIYVTDFQSSSLTVIDGATNGTTTIAMDAYPWPVAVNEATGNVYVANHRNSGNGNIFVIGGTPASGKVTVSTSPSGLSFSVDGVSYTVPTAFQWNMGSVHNVCVTSPQAGTTGMQYVFNNWSDFGSMCHSVTMQSSLTALTASFKTQCQLTTAVSPSGSGSVTPASGAYYDYGTTVDLQATANSGFVFKSWTGSTVASSSSASTTIMMTGPKSVTANFTNTTTLTLASSLNPSIYGNNVTFTASIAPAAATGMVTFYDGSTSIGTDTLSAGTAKVTTASLTKGSHTITASYGGDANDNAATSNAVGQVVNPATLMVTANDKLRAYGAANPVLDGTLTGVIAGDGITASYSTTATVASPVGTYPITPTLNDPGGKLFNYAITINNGTLTIKVVPLTVTADAKNKVYGTGDPALTYNITSGALVGSDSLSGSLTRAAGENVGHYAILQGTLTAGSNYNLSFVSADLTITPAPLTVTADAKNKVYGTADPALTYQITSGALVGSDNLSGSLTRVAGENVGHYAIQQGTLTAGSNYNLSFVSADLTITPAPLTVTADPKNKIYGTADPALTYQITSGALVGSDSLSGSLTRVAGENVGHYAIQQGTLTAGSNYNLSFVSADLTITPTPLTVTADPKTKIYGTADPALTYQITSGTLVSGDNLSGSLARAAGENIGHYAIQQGTLTAGSNYNLSFVSADLTITPALLTVTADLKNKVYGTADPALTYQITSGALKSGDNLSGSLTRVAGESVGTYAIQQGSLTAGSNYNLSFVGSSLTIGPAALTLTANDKQRAYGAANPLFDGTLTGVVAGDGITASYSTSATASSSVGAYPIIPALNDPNHKLGNYAVTITNGTLTVGPVTLTVKADNKSMTYGGAVPTLTATITGFVNGESVTVLSGSPALLTPASSASGAGTYAITVGLGSLAATNYTFAFAGGTLTINKATLTVIADNKTMVSGSTVPVLTASYSGFLNGDQAGVLSGTPALSTAVTSSTTPGNYVITATQGTLAAANYNFVFVNGVMSVTIASGTVQLVATATLTKQSDGSYMATVTVTNKGTLDAANVQLTSASLGTASGSPVPQSLGKIIAGGSAVVTASFPSSAGISGAMVVEKLAGTYTGGTFQSTLRAILP